MAEAVRRAVETSPTKGLNLESVRSQARYKPTPSLRRSENSKLGPEVETFLVEIIQAFSTEVSALTKKMVRDIAGMIAPTAGPFGKKWLTLFLNRHPDEITLRKGRKSHSRKVLLKALPLCLAWAEDTEKIVKKEAYKAKDVYNLDESKALTSAISDKLLASAILTQVQYKLVLESTLYTLVSCISADGDVLFVMYIFRKAKAKTFNDQPINIPTALPRRVSRNIKSFPIYYAMTPAGYMNGALWKEVLKIFIKLAGERQGLNHQDPALLFMDGCASHLKSFTPMELAKENITTVWFPSNTSHILQPCDGAHFAAYKRGLSSALAETNIQSLISGDNESKYSLLQSIEAFKRASTPAIIQASFRDRGIWPFRQSVIAGNAAAAVGAVTSIEPDQQLVRSFLNAGLFDKLKAYLKKEKKTETKYIGELNTPKKGNELPKVRLPKNPRAKKASAKKTTAPVLEDSSSSDSASTSSDVSNWEGFIIDGIEAREEEELPAESSDEEDYECPYCSHLRRHKPQSVCMTCNIFFVCVPCADEGKALTEHFRATICGQIGGRESRRKSTK